MRSVSKYGVLTGLAVIAAWAATPAVAGVTFYTSQSAYQSALAAASLSASSFNFNSVPSGSYANATGLTIDGVNFVSSNGNGGYYLYLAPPYACCDDYNNPNWTLQAAAPTSNFYGISDGVTTITLPTGAMAFSFDAYTVQAGDYSGSGQDTLNLDVGGSIGQTQTFPGSTTGFLGFLSTTPVSSVTLYGTTNEDFIDIVDGSVASSSAVPEPSAWAMMLAGLGVVGATLRRRSRLAGSLV